MRAIIVTASYTSTEFDEMHIGFNMEFVRSQDLSFESGIECAARRGYRFVEPMVHNGRELLSEAGYFHSFSMDNDPLEMKDILNRHGVRASDYPLIVR